MFQCIPEPVINQMRRLEALDAADRQDGTPRLRRLRQVSPETGRFLALLLAAAPGGQVVEIGTSAGYSTLWLALACALRADSVTTFEISPEKAELARRTFEDAGISGRVRLIQGDARRHLGEQPGIAFCFLDAEKDIYAECYGLLVPGLVPGGLLVADNVISHEAELTQFIHDAESDSRVDSAVVPMGKGLLVCRRC